MIHELASRFDKNSFESACIRTSNLEVLFTLYISAPEHFTSGNGAVLEISESHVNWKCGTARPTSETISLDQVQKAAKLAGLPLDDTVAKNFTNLLGQVLGHLASDGEGSDLPEHEAEPHEKTGGTKPPRVEKIPKIHTVVLAFESLYADKVACTAHANSYQLTLKTLKHSDPERVILVGSSGRCQKGIRSDSPMIQKMIQEAQLTVIPLKKISENTKERFLFTDAQIPEECVPDGFVQLIAD